MGLHLGCTSSKEDAGHGLADSVGCTGYNDMQGLAPIILMRTCGLCGKENETSFHVLITCDHAWSLWLHMCQVCYLPGDELLVDNKSGFQTMLQQCPDSMLDNIMLIWRFGTFAMNWCIIRRCHHLLKQQWSSWITIGS